LGAEIPKRLRICLMREDIRLFPTAYGTTAK